MVASTTPPARKQRGATSPEFLLVIAFLVVLSFLVPVVLLAPTPEVTGTNITGRDVLDYRKNILAIILTTFGAWVGAGAAYYFGRENVRQATESLLAMKGPSPRERLRQKQIRELPLRDLGWFVREDEKVGNVLKKLEEVPVLWFIPVVNANGVLTTVLDEEAVYRFIADKIPEAITAGVPNPYDDIINRTMKEVEEFAERIEKEAKKGYKRFKDVFVRVTKDQSAGEANDLMASKGVMLAVVIDEGGKPTHFITTADVREALLQLD